MNVRVLCNSDGSISIVYPAPKSRRQDETEDQWLTRVFDKATSEGAAFKDIDISSISADRTFRDAWELNGDVVSVNMPKARAIHMNRIRTLRNEKLKDLDVDYIMAMEASDQTKMDEIAVLKRTLRDIPKTFDLSVAKTPEELKNLMPDIL